MEGLGGSDGGALVGISPKSTTKIREKLENWKYLQVLEDAF
jgi:hypothetical protein